MVTRCTFLKTKELQFGKKSLEKPYNFNKTIQKAPRKNGALILYYRFKITELVFKSDIFIYVKEINKHE